jgi:hypothetical protein
MSLTPAAGAGVKAICRGLAIGIAGEWVGINVSKWPGAITHDGAGDIHGVKISKPRPLMSVGRYLVDGQCMATSGSPVVVITPGTGDRPVIVRGASTCIDQPA